MSTLVTGSRGQIGSRCLARLDDPGLGLDLHGGPDVVECDLRAPLSRAQQESLADVKRVIHLAGSREDPPFNAAAAWQATEANAIGTANLLAALPQTVEHVVLVSSISVYGRDARGAKLVEHGPIQPRSAYGASKANAEHIARLWSDRTDTPLTVARVAQVYGEGTDSRNGLYRMLVAALTGDAIVLSCRPDMRRDYIHVEDVARILCSLVALPANRVVNVGSGHGITMIELAELITSLCSGPPPITRAHDDAGEDLVVDTSLLASLGLEPVITMADGVRAERERLGARP